MKRTIEFTVFNKFLNNEWVFQVLMPYNPYKSLDGYYSNWWRKMKPVICQTENAPPQNIYLRTRIISKKTDRVIYRWPSGVMLDMPKDSTKFDYEIVLAQLDVIKMRFNRPHNPHQG